MARTIRASQHEIVCVVYALASLALRDVVEFLGSSLETIKSGVNSRTDEWAKGEGDALDPGKELSALHVRLEDLRDVETLAKRVVKKVM